MNHNNLNIIQQECVNIEGSIRKLTDVQRVLVVVARATGASVSKPTKLCNVERGKDCQDSVYGLQWHTWFQR